MSEFEELVAGCRRGEAGAIAELVVRYLPHVRAAVRQRLSRRLRVRFDSHDFTQNVWASFFQITLDRLDLPTEAALVGYLSRIAELKVIEEFRKQVTRKLDFRRDVPLARLPEMPGATASPSGEVMAGDRWSALTAGLSERERGMLRMLHDGHTQEAVAERFGLTVRTVHRLLARVRRSAEDVA